MLSLVCICLLRSETFVFHRTRPNSFSVMFSFLFSMILEHCVKYIKVCFPCTILVPIQYNPLLLMEFSVLTYFCLFLLTSLSTENVYSYSLPKFNLYLFMKKLSCSIHSVMRSNTNLFFLLKVCICLEFYLFNLISSVQDFQALAVIFLL